jgi:2,3-bisphosphoglycerate-independent phosphoglycerate mutase
MKHIIILGDGMADHPIKKTKWKNSSSGNRNTIYGFVG